MKVLVVGEGGREHALVWALARSPHATLHCAPGSDGIAKLAQRVALRADDVEALARHAVEERYDLVVVGPEVPLVAGLADRLRQAGITTFGPSAAAARIEGSKVFAKEFMARHGIPTGGFRVFDDAALARRFLESAGAEYPLVVKADGLAAGKGVVIASERDTAVRTAEQMLSGRSFGAAGKRIVVEQMLSGTEASFFVLCDGRKIVELAPCQDYKRAFDGDRGPNTGGMGSYSPSAHLSEAQRRVILDRIVVPTITGLAKDGCPYTGVLYVGVMLTTEGPKVLEFNARFGDPETQVLLPRLDGDWLELLHRCATGELGDTRLRWRADAAVCVVLASGGYPGAYEKGLRIHGVEQAEASPNVVVFHAGTEARAGDFVTRSGRVLGVTGLGSDVAAARETAYEAVSRIHWDGEQHRTDIALDAVLLSRGGPPA